jgi:hypothetical protein
MNQAWIASQSKSAGLDSPRGDPQEANSGITGTRTTPHQWSGHMCVNAVATSGSDPKATLVASEAGLMLSGELGDFELSPAVVQRILGSGVYPWLWAGIQICHSVRSYPQHLKFCPMGIGSHEVLAQLKPLGFKTA